MVAVTGAVTTVVVGRVTVVVPVTVVVGRVTVVVAVVNRVARLRVAAAAAFFCFAFAARRIFLATGGSSRLDFAPNVLIALQERTFDCASQSA